MSEFRIIGKHRSRITRLSTAGKVESGAISGPKHAIDLTGRLVYNFSTHDKINRAVFPPPPGLHFFAVAQPLVGETDAPAPAPLLGQADDK